MKKSELQSEFKKAIDDTQRFIDTANYNGGMGIEARLKLVENQLNDIFWFIHKLVDSMPDDENKNEDPAENVDVTK